MAEGMNQMNQDDLMLVNGFEQMANAFGAKIPIDLAEDLAALRNGMPMNDNLRKRLSDASMRLGQQLKDEGLTPDMINNTNPDIMNVPPKGDSNMGAVSDSEMQMMQDTLSRLGLPPMTDEERMSYQVDDRIEQMTPSQMAGERSRGAITPDAGRVMSLEEAIAAGFVNPTRPQARPAAPMTSMRPQARPMR